MRNRFSLRGMLAAALFGMILLFAQPLCAVASQADPAVWDDEAATHIALNGTGADIKGDGAELTGSTLAISLAGTYVLSGTWEDGQVIVEVGKKDTVQLVLNGASITCKNGAPLYVRKGDLVLTLADGTENTLEDGTDYASQDEEDAPDAALYAQGSLTIGGTGSLAVTAHYNHGVVSKDDLLVAGGSITVTAASVGLRGRDSLEVTGGTITVNSQGDAVQSNNDEDAAKGWIRLSGGTLHLVSAKDGIQAETSLVISGGDFEIITGGGAQAAFEDAKEEDGANSVGKGLKAGTDLTVTGGTFRLDCYDDALNANGGITVKGGTFTAATGDDAIHAATAFTLEGGTLTFSACKEVAEVPSVQLSGGTFAAACTSEKAQAAGGDSSQVSLAVRFHTAQTAGTQVVLTGAGGESLFTLDPSQAYESVFFTSPDLQEGKACSLTVDGKAMGEMTLGKASFLWEDGSAMTDED